jgi:putative ABC transport system substrate-binding protein
LIGGAAAWPVAARAQQQDRMRFVGVLASPAADRVLQSQLAVFQDELRKLGWADGKNIRFDIRWGSGDFDLVRSGAAALVGLGPDAIFSIGAAATAALQRATSTIPIVFVQVADPVGRRLHSKLGASRRQHHWFYESRICDGRQMAGIA